MTIQKLNSNPAFSGKLSSQTVKKFSEALGEEGAKTAKKFRAGKNKQDKISVIYDSYPQNDIYRGKYLVTDTYMEVVNPSAKKPPLRVLLANGKLPFTEHMLELIESKMKLVDKIKNKVKK